ncbi:alpha/beta hydrolase-fold protein, partial [Phenylobacterium sp.]|uniref:alpha/beta hydrolase-fold protein n=1 Tax=Phenylobacterium sp. TaxID=1871053 RepID=UPI00286D09D1
MSLEILQQHRVHGGTLSYRRHASAATGTPMRFSIFLPPGDGPFPWVIWLSGLTCTEDNFTTKAGAYAAAARLGLAVVAPDTSPRGEGVADDPAYDLGQGAGFYVDATQASWAPHFRMETYITADLIAAVTESCPVDPARLGVFGHSMGGHGALTLALRHPELFRSVSAFAPICSPTRCDWGR